MGVRRWHTAFFFTIIAIARVLEEKVQLSFAKGVDGNNILTDTTGIDAPYPVPAGISTGHVLFDYIGSNGVNITFDDIPVNTSTNITYVLGLSFAIDMDNTGATQNGNFQMHLSPSLTPAAAQSWRARYPNSRISIAIGGSVYYDAKGGEHPVNWYDPADELQWLANAIKSLTSIVQAYGADGIDIDIERFPNGSTSFVPLIGGLVTTLKETGFYGEGLNTSAKYLARYKQVIAKLPANKIGPSTQVDLDPNTITGPEFYQTVEKIRDSYGIAGVFLWNADLSKQKDNFQTERSISGFL
ncbi:unnamed protein product [Calypogeia fissa]